MTDPARDFFQGADAIQRRPIAEAQMRDAVEALQRLELYRDAYSDLIAALAAQSGDSPSSIRQVVKARAEGSEKDLIDKLQGTLDLLRHSVQQMREELDRLRAENARLIAATPELVEALKLWARWDDMTEAELALALEATTAALAKAGVL